MVDFSFRVRVKEDGIFKVLKGKKKKPCQPRILSLTKVVFQKEGEIKAFDKDKPGKFTTTRLDLGDLLKSILQAKKVAA